MAAMAKHLRELVKNIEAEFPGINVELVRQRVHYIYELNFEGTVRHISVGKSPRCPEHAVDNALKDARRYFAAAEAHA